MKHEHAAPPTAARHAGRALDPPRPPEVAVLDWAGRLEARRSLRRVLADR